MLQTLDGDTEIPSDFSFLSPPTFFQPLPDPSPIPFPQPNHLLSSSSQQEHFPASPQQQESLSISSPSVILDDFSTYPHSDGSPISFPAHQQFMSDSMGGTPFTSDSPIYDYDYYNHSSDIVTNPPLSSSIPTEANSAVVSDSDLPPLQVLPSKQVQQTGLLNFFSVIPADEAYATEKRGREPT